jgi:hypothetical protein
MRGRRDGSSPARAELPHGDQEQQEAEHYLDPLTQVAVEPGELAPAGPETLSTGPGAAPIASASDPPIACPIWSWP